MEPNISENLELNVAFLGNRGFPYKIGAEISRLKLMAKGLAENHCRVLVIIRKGSRYVDELPVSGHADGAEFIYSCGRVRRRESVFLHALDIIRGAVFEVILLRRRKINVVIVISRNFWEIVNYWIWSRIFGFKLILNYVEYSSQLRGRKKNMFKRINDILFEHYVFFMVHGIFPISEILTKVALSVNPSLPYLKVPVLVDFSSFGQDSKPVGNYFVFCGHASYYYAFEFVVGSFELIDHPDFRLKLVIYGDPKDIVRIKAMLDRSVKKSQIDLISDLSFHELFSYYSQATALLVPLKPTLKDEARFPHKIGEYVASGRPVITTDFGEIRAYFTDGKNALIAKEFDLRLYADKMELAITNPGLMAQLGTSGQHTGKKYFDYRDNGTKMKKFMDQLIQ